jgi:YHS domain-containing protein
VPPLEKDNYFRENRMKVKDLFCGMDVETESAPAKYKYLDKVYYFCDLACQQMFMLNPEKYIQIDEGKQKP